MNTPKTKKYFEWLKDNWQKASVLVAIYVVVMLIPMYSQMKLINFVLFFSFPLYILHEIEEYILPGGFDNFLNTNILGVKDTSGIVPLDRDVIFWINFVYVWFALPVFSSIAIFDLKFAAWIPYFFIFQALAHLAMGIKGKMVINPGIRSSFFLHLPYAILLLSLFVKEGVITNVYFNIHLFIGLAANLILPIVALMPNKYGIMRRYHDRIGK